MDRDNLINIPLDMIRESHNRIALRWCTGLGKSRAAIEVANLISKEKKDNLRVLLVVAEVAHKENWEGEFQRWNLCSCNLVVECYASLKKWKDSYWDLVIFDEAHHLTTDLRIDILKTIVAERIILLSATLSEQSLGILSNIYGEFQVSTIKLSQAIESGMLPKPSIYLIPLVLDDKCRTELIIEEWGDKEKRELVRCHYYERWKYKKDKTAYPNVRLEVTCTQLEKYRYINEQLIYWKNRFFRGNQIFAKNKWLQYGSQRKRFLGECKAEFVRPLIKKLEDESKRFICFCSSIEQAKSLGEDYAIHSERDDSGRIIREFNSHIIDRIFAVGMLQEGQNLDSIDAGIIIQLDGNERSFIQKFGRTLRSKKPMQFIFYYRGTRDQEYLDKILEEVNDEDIIELDINDIDYDNYYK